MLPHRSSSCSSSRPRRCQPRISPDLEAQFRISRRTLQRTRAKLSRMGVIERVTWMNARYGGREGWLLSGRMSGALHRLADLLDEWKRDKRSDRQLKDAQLVELLR
jgi:hypothetical protein